MSADAAAPDDPDESFEPAAPAEPDDTPVDQVPTADGLADDAQADDDRPAPPRPELPDTHEGDRLVLASWVGTTVFVATSCAAVAVESLVVISVPVALVLFALGTGAFLVAYFRAIGRSRTDLIGIGGLYFLAGCAPRRVQRQLMGSFAVEVVVALVTASLRLYTPLAFGVLAPIYGLGLAGLWGATHGVFPPRPPEREVGRAGRSTGAAVDDDDSA